MGKSQATKNDKGVYVSLGLLNMSVIVTLASILTFATMPVSTVVLADSPGIVAKTPKQQKAIVGTPVRVTVPSVGIDINVRPGVYDAQYGTWNVDDSSAFHATMTVPANNANGTTLIYGHAIWGVFGTLPSTAAGAEAFVYTREGYTFQYAFQSSKQVVPTDVSDLTTTGEPRLLMQTCSGPFDAYRTLVAFELKGVVRSD